jgi:DNA-binding transcriptional LysR family regulator
MKVASELNFTKAAEKLYISQQSLSQHIKRLEQYYQVELFERKPETKLTFAGEQVLTFVKQVEQAEEKLLAELSFIQKSEKGRIMLGVNSSRSPLIVPMLITKFKQIHPNIMLSLRELPTSQLEGSLSNGEIDLLIGIRGNDSLKDENFNIIELMQDKNIYLIASDSLIKEYYPNFLNNKALYEKGISIGDFIELPIVLNTLTSRTHMEIKKYFNSHGLTPHILIESNNNGFSLLPMCKQGVVAFYTTQIQLCQMLNQFPDLKQQVTILPIKDLLLEYSVVLMYHKDKAISKFMYDLIIIVKEVCTQIEEILHVLFEEYSLMRVESRYM